MATFTPEQQPLGTPNFTWRSRGIDSSPNTGIGKLFEGLAQGLDTGVKVADQAEQRKITDDIQAQSERIQNDFDTKSEAFLGFGGQSSADLPLPAGFKSGAANIQNLQAAKLQGKLPDLYYWNRLNIMTKQLKAQYPGYADKIDDMVAGVVGAKPANRLQAELSDAWASAYQGSGQTDPLTKLAQKMSDDGSLLIAAPDYYQRLQNGDPYTYTELMQKQSTWNMQDAKDKAQKAQVGLEVDQNTLTGKKATQQYQQASVAGMSFMLTNTQSTIGKDYNQLATLVNKLNDERAKGVLPTQQEQAQMEALGNELPVAARAYLNRIYTSQWDPNDPNPQKSWSYWVSPADRKAADDSAMEPVNLISQALKDKDFGLLGAVSAWLAANKNDGAAAILQNYPVLRNISAAQAVLGDQTTSVMLSNSKTQGQYADALSGVLAGHMMTLQGANPNPAPPSKIFVDSEKLGVGTETAQNMIDKWHKLSNLINDPKMNTDAIKNGVDWVTSEPPDQFFQAFTPDAAQSMFQQMASPVVTKNLLAYKDLGNTETWNKYVTWVRNAFLIQGRQAIDNLQTANQMNLLTIGKLPDNAYNIKFDPATNQFTDTGYFSAYTKADIDNLNRDIAAVVPIMTADKMDVRKELAAWLASEGFNGQRSGVLDGLLKSLAPDPNDPITKWLEEARAKAKANG